MASFRNGSPALEEILNKLQSMVIVTDIDHHLYEIGSIHYNVQVFASNANFAYISIWMPLIFTQVMDPYKSLDCSLQDIMSRLSDTIEVIETPKEGYVLTLRLNVDRFQQQSKEDCKNIIKAISSLQTIILSSQLKAILWNIGSQDTSNELLKPIKIVYHPREPFFITKMPQQLSVTVPMRFKDNSDVILATSFFQELMDVGNSWAHDKTPRCTWSPIPPPNLRGEHFEHLITNGGFVTFDIFSKHLKGEKADMVVWILLKFNEYVKYHVKQCTRAFIQRKMRQRMGIMCEVIQNARIRREASANGMQTCEWKANCQCGKKLKKISRPVALRNNFKVLTNQIKLFRSRIKIKGLHKIKRHWFGVPKFTSFGKYKKFT
ncbi:hypothetical protein HPP92_014713 [Vanilla planifolia]|uniref:Arp2/3 complex 34 kDa subunit n=1 Tax=Vanilla planifolia TaxID=51239 RepID=A0A835UV08_VANPL|nr:hypothetical protein HPP92_014713 [Vanilla planifolia]